MGSQFLMSILKDSGIADIAISIVDYFIGRKDSKNAQNGKGGIKDRKGLTFPLRLDQGLAPLISRYSTIFLLRFVAVKHLDFWGLLVRERLLPSSC